MSLTLSGCYFQSCSTTGNFTFIKNSLVVGNFFAITSIEKYKQELANNDNDLDEEIPTDLPSGFSRSPDTIQPYYSYTGTRAEGIKVLSDGGAIERAILGQ